VPLLRSVKSSVTPDGTATSERTIVEQDVFDLLAEEAPLSPENVQVVERLSRLAAGVTIGAATGLAITAALKAPMATASVVERGAIFGFLTEENGRKCDCNE